MALNLKMLALAAAGLGGLYFVMTKSNAASDSEDTGTDTTSVVYGGGGNFSVGQTTQGSANDVLAQVSAATLAQSNNDLTLGLAKTAAQREVDLADINATRQLGLASSAITMQAQATEALAALKKNGMSGYSANVGGVEFDMTALYTDTRKNLALASGYNARGDLVSKEGTILMMGGQSKLDMAKYIGIDGKPALAPIGPLAAFDMGSNPKNSTTTPTRIIKRNDKQNLGSAGTDYRARKEH